MTTSRMSAARRPRPGRRALIALMTGAGVLLTPVAAQAAAPAPSAAAPAAVVAATPAAQTAVDTALAQLGDPYVWAAAGPNSFDCSGLTQYAYKAAGVSLPHSSKTQSTMGTAVAKADLRPGDLVFFYSPVSHVGMYIGDGKIVHAPSAGDVVKVSNLSSMPSYNTARRLAG
jgi:cell wall-associated NlpC family hydrolase